MSSESTGGTSIKLANGPQEYEAFIALACEYIASLGFEVDFQDVEAEMADAAHRYGETGRGAALLVVDETETIVGIAGIRDLGDGVCELKRMYVRPAFRGSGLGKRLCEASIRVARELGYLSMRLDTLERMAAENRLYDSQGFQRIPSYTVNPMPDALFYELELNGTSEQA